VAREEISMISEAEYQILLGNQARANGSTSVIPPKKRRGCMNKLEERFMREVLEARKAVGMCRWYDFEPLKFRLATGAWYTPDFVSFTESGICCWETKGFWREAARVRIKVAAEKYPFPFVAVTHEKSQWKYEYFIGRKL
jgi:hypothetical protein